jgi:transposase
MIQRGGQVVIQMLENIQQATIQSIIQSTIAPGTLIYTDKQTIYDRLESWGYARKSVSAMTLGNRRAMRIVTGSMKFT